MSRSDRPKDGAPAEGGPTLSSGDAAPRARPRILCVDDEPMVLKSLATMLRKHFEVVSDTRAADALLRLGHDAGVRVVISDYRMPGMDGTAFLTEVRERFPTITRMLLSGAGAESVADHSELVFRTLTKPCPRDTLIAAIEDALAWGNDAATSPQG